ncbi:hypothetical protein HUJ05_007675 [Dendroctonus ponderosae]|nr:hypothetical protein HUJ05_007675 [Dendroctonus ponderosae]
MWDRKETGVEIFWLTMSKQRFLFLLKHLRFDDRTTREERNKTDKLAPIREVFDIFAVQNSRRSTWAFTIWDWAVVKRSLEENNSQSIPTPPRRKTHAFVLRGLDGNVERGAIKENLAHKGLEVRSVES